MVDTVEEEVGCDSDAVVRKITEDISVRYPFPTISRNPPVYVKQTTM
jgi:hypothetical protein